MAKVAFGGLEAALRRNTPFRLFEAYRSPEMQQLMFDRGTSKARPMRSAHQYGLACDFVPYINGRWTWDPPAGLWEVLADEARTFGLVVPIAWDKVHVEHPLWRSVHDLIRAR